MSELVKEATYIICGYLRVYFWVVNIESRWEGFEEGKVLLSTQAF